MQWIPEQIVGIGEDFHRQVDDVKVTTTLYKVRWIGYDRTGDTWEPITLLQGYAYMVKVFKESHVKDVERLTADRRWTSPVWTMVMFQMVTGDSCQCMKRTKQNTTSNVNVRYGTFTVSGCAFVVRYQNRLFPYLKHLRNLSCQTGGQDTHGG